MNDVPKVTVVIPTYNRAKEIKMAIKSVRKQTLENWKALIIDDGSTDDTEKVVNQLIGDDKRFIYHKMPQNMGICQVLNTALSLVDTKYMVQLDSDDWLEKNALEKLLKKMEKNQNAALAYGNHKSRYSDKKAELQKQRAFKSKDKYELLCYAPMVYPRFYRTSCLQEVGGWEVNDKYNGRFMEDRRILFRLIEKYDFVWVNQHLYNLRRTSQKRLTAKENRTKYTDLKKTLIKEALERWGNKYQAKFTLKKPGGWKFNVRLIKRKR